MSGHKSYDDLLKEISFLKTCIKLREKENNMTDQINDQMVEAQGIIDLDIVEATLAAHGEKPELNTPVFVQTPDHTGEEDKPVVH